MIEVKLVAVTPAVAAAWLAASRNRPGAAKVARFAAMITSGTWRAATLSDPPVRVTADGQLVDGGHRCAAVAASRQTVTLAVAQGGSHADQVVGAAVDRAVRRRLPSGDFRACDVQFIRACAGRYPEQVARTLACVAKLCAVCFSAVLSDAAVESGVVKCCECGGGSTAKPKNVAAQSRSASVRAYVDPDDREDGAGEDLTSVLARLFGNAAD